MNADRYFDAYDRRADDEPEDDEYVECAFVARQRLLVPRSQHYLPASEQTERAEAA